MHHYLVLFGPSTGYSHYLAPTCLRDGEQLIQNILPISWALLVLTLAVMPWQDALDARGLPNWFQVLALPK